MSHFHILYQKYYQSSVSRKTPIGNRRGSEDWWIINVPSALFTMRGYHSEKDTQSAIKTFADCTSPQFCCEQKTDIFICNIADMLFWWYFPPLLYSINMLIMVDLAVTTPGSIAIMVFAQISKQTSRCS